MFTIFPLLTEAEAFRPVRVAGQSIFRRDCDGHAMFYAPGYLCVVDLENADRFEGAIGPQDGRRGTELWHRAEQAVAESNRWQDEPFAPECLTLYMNNECNLRCVYCHTDPTPQPTARLELDVIAAAGDVVAENCRKKNRPFYVVFHGGGEPALHRERVESALTTLEGIASAHDVEPFRYVATNGVMTEEKAAWLARHFDLIGLSCDGPADIQNNQRPRWNGEGTFHIVERTAHVLREEGVEFQVRTTITGASLHRQADIANYICQQFSPEEIHFEPVYIGGRTSIATGLGAHQAGDFVKHFLEARKIARQYGIRLLCSGSRPDSIHGPYCHVFRHTLNLAPGDVATACFKVTDVAHVVEKGAAIGAMNRRTGRFEIDQSRVQELRRQLGPIPPRCADCFNCYHCVRECPDRCPLDKKTSEVSPEPSFRCRTQKALAYATLRETAENLWITAMTKGDGAQEHVCGTEIV
jgi:sulfatase maturation enzyme AslB (radical SAM superfamily)